MKERAEKSSKVEVAQLREALEHQGNIQQKENCGIKWMTVNSGRQSDGLRVHRL